MSITSTAIHSAPELPELLSPLLAQATPSSTPSRARDAPNVFNFSQSSNVNVIDVDDNHYSIGSSNSSSDDAQLPSIMDNDRADDDVADAQDNNKQVIFLLFFK